MNSDTVKRAAALMREANDLLARGPLDYYLTEMTAAYDLLMQRFSPFKVGDKVQLAKAPAIEPISGWRAWQHLMHEGATGRVVCAECGSQGFMFGVVWDADTDSNPGQFKLAEHYLQPNVRHEG